MSEPHQIFITKLYSEDTCFHTGVYLSEEERFKTTVDALYEESLYNHHSYTIDKDVLQARVDQGQSMTETLTQTICEIDEPGFYAALLCTPMPDLPSDPPSAPHTAWMLVTIEDGERVLWQLLADRGAALPALVQAHSDRVPALKGLDHEDFQALDEALVALRDADIDVYLNEVSMPGDRS